MKRIPLWLLKASHRIYKTLLSPLFGQCCRFYPGCSDYAVEAIEQHRFLKGAWLALKRLLRCHPYTDGGFDPVPVGSKSAPQGSGNFKD